MNEDLFNKMVKKELDNFNQIVQEKMFEEETDFMNAVCDLEFALFTLIQEKMNESQRSA